MMTWKRREQTMNDVASKKIVGPILTNIEPFECHVWIGGDMLGLMGWDD